MDRATAEFLDLNQYQGAAIALCFDNYPSQGLEVAYEQAIASRSEEKRSKSFAFLIPRLSEKHRRDIWNLRQQFLDPECRARLLISFLPYRIEALNPLLDLLKLFENQKKLEFLMGSLPAPADIIQEIFKTLLTISQPSDRWAYLVQLLPYLSRDLEAGFVEVLEDTPYQTEGMRMLLQTLQPQQTSLAKGIISTIETIPPVFERATAIQEVVPLLSEEMKFQLLPVAQGIEFPYAQVIALQNFIPTFPEIAQGAINALKNCHAESPDDVYENLVPKLSGAERREAIELMENLVDDTAKLDCLVRTLPYQADLLPSIQALLANQEKIDVQTALKALHQALTKSLGHRDRPENPITLIESTLPLIDALYQPGLTQAFIQTDIEFAPILNQYIEHFPPQDICQLSHIDLLLDFFHLIPPESQRAETLANIIMTITENQTDNQKVTPEQWLRWLEKSARFQPHEFHWLLSSLLHSLMSFSHPHALNPILQSIRVVREQWQ
ncbi:MAG: hypothetical protein HC810_03315 [Acaryochloridaceae cyanobacterium RL_2_7]|nr:hypothetical protein [Acaryochloridaceae cyanobacterium RL_2_7]